MSYTTFPSVSRAAAPVATDDNTKGFVIGSQWVDTSAAPRKVYVCTDASTGSSVWLAAGGVTSHSALSPISLGWSGAGHTGTQNSVACFDATGAAQTLQATTDGTVLTYTGGILTFAVYTQTVSYLSAKNYEINYINALNDAAPSASVQAGQMV